MIAGPLADPWPTGLMARRVRSISATAARANGKTGAKLVYVSTDLIQASET